MADNNNNDQKITAFQDSVHKEIDDEINYIISHASEERSRIIEQAKDDFLNDSFRRISDETKIIKNKCRHRVSKQSFDSNKAVLEKRNSLIDEFFFSLEKKLKDFTASKEYDNYLAKTLKDINKTQPLYEGVVVHVNNADLTKSSLLGDVKGVRLEASKKIKLGGMTIFYPNEKLYIDLTLDKQLKKERENFTKNPELRL